MEYLPSLNAKYSINEKHNLKFATSKTYTLPQFKERAPFLYEEVGQSYFGNPYLYNSTDYNADLKWEYFPKNGEVISVTGFGKLIQNPINEITVVSATNDITWVNSGKQAVGLGVEFELRKKIYEIESGENKTNLNFGVNASYLHTDQDLDEEKVRRETEETINASFTEDRSKLSGASDLLVNTDLSFNKDFSSEKAVTATLAAGYFSERIAAIGVNDKGNLVDYNPNIVGSLDFILKYKINKNLGIGISAKNLTDPTFKRKQIGTLGNSDIIIDSYKKGRNFSFSLKYTF